MFLLLFVVQVGLELLMNPCGFGFPVLSGSVGMDRTTMPGLKYIFDTRINDGTLT